MLGSGGCEPDGSPVVSVAMTAFNSAHCIARAIESVLRQDAKFPVEIVVGDDCSSDRTAEVVRSFCTRYPERVRLLARPQRRGMQRNFYETFESCRGRYIAWLDADDVWTDPEKLKLQVEWLERDARTAICGHFVRSVRGSGEVVNPRWPNRPAGRYGLADIILSNFVPSLSIVFRNGLQRDLGDWFFELSGVADWPLLLMGACRGDIYLLDRVMADYTVNPGSAYGAKGFLHHHNIDMEVRRRMESVLPTGWHRQVRRGIGREFESLAYWYRVTGDYEAARAAALQALRTPGLTDNMLTKTRAAAAVAWDDTRSRLRRMLPLRDAQ